jgi:acyl-CoA hydrolase
MRHRSHNVHGKLSRSSVPNISTTTATCSAAFLLKWVDEISWIAASRDHPGCHFVTVAMDQVEFRKSVRQGTVLRFKSRRARVGKTSVQYTVKVYSDNLTTGTEESVFSTHVTFVCLDGAGHKMALPGSTRV